jgi:hypothetical protein
MNQGMLARVAGFTPSSSSSGFDLGQQPNHFDLEGTGASAFEERDATVHERYGMSPELRHMGSSLNSPVGGSTPAQ